MVWIFSDTLLQQFHCDNKPLMHVLKRRLSMLVCERYKKNPFRCVKIAQLTSALNKNVVLNRACISFAYRRPSLTYFHLLRWLTLNVHRNYKSKKSVFLSFQIVIIIFAPVNRNFLYVSISWKKQLCLYQNIRPNWIN